MITRLYALGGQPMLAINETALWYNKDNQTIYEHFNKGEIDRYYSNLGIGNKDLDALGPLIEQATDVLEVGAGSGRVVNYILEHHPEKQVVAVERVTAFYQNLEEHYGHRAVIVHSDIMQYRPRKTFDTILLLWAGICEFNLEEQENLVAHLSALQSDDGCLVIETMMSAYDSSNVTTIQQSNDYLIERGDDTMHCHIPSLSAMQCMGAEAGYQSVTPLYYQSRDCKRVLYVLRK